MSVCLFVRMKERGGIVKERGRACWLSGASVEIVLLRSVRCVSASHPCSRDTNHNDERRSTGHHQACIQGNSFVPPSWINRVPFVVPAAAASSSLPFCLPALLLPNSIVFLLLAKWDQRGFLPDKISRRLVTYICNERASNVSSAEGENRISK